MTKLLILALIALFVITGCGTRESADSDTSQPAQTEQDQASAVIAEGGDIMPLAAGYRWEFQNQQMNPNSGQLEKTSNIIYDITADTLIEGETWFKINGMGPESTWGANRDDGFWIIAPTGQPMLMAKYPAEAGDEFSRVQGGVAFTKVASGGESVAVPAGSFQCLKYIQEFAGSGHVTNSYFAPGVGPVKIEIINVKYNKTVMIAELVSAKTN